MSEQIQTSLEEAKRCPKCQQPGQIVSGHDHSLSHDPRGRVTRGAVIRTVFCRNQRCKWYNTSWVVQFNPDGTIPPPTTNRERFFKALPGDAKAVEENLALLEQRTREANAEIANRHSR